MVSRETRYFVQPERRLPFQWPISHEHYRRDLRDRLLSSQFTFTVPSAIREKRGWPASHRKLSMHLGIRPHRRSSNKRFQPNTLTRCDLTKQFLGINCFSHHSLRHLASAPLKMLSDRNLSPASLLASYTYAKSPRGPFTRTGILKPNPTLTLVLQTPGELSDFAPQKASVRHKSFRIKTGDPSVNFACSASFTYLRCGCAESHLYC